MPSQYNIEAGIDVHKRVLMVVLGQTGGEASIFAERCFESSHSGLVELREWPRAQAVYAVVMESTTQHWWPVWLELQQEQIQKWTHFLAQARSNKAPRGRKTDRDDATRLVRRFCSGDLRYSFVPSAEQRSRRRLARTWKSLGEQIVEARNEIEALLEEGQIKPSCVLSDLLGASGRRILAALAEGGHDAKTLAGLCDRRVRMPEAERMDALTGQLPAAQRLVLRQQLERIETLDQQRAELQAALTNATRSIQPVVRKLTFVPGINVVAAQHLIAEIGPDVAAFPSAGNLASWAGACPGRQESAGVSRSDSCPKGNRFVRSLLCQIAHAATNTKGTSWQSKFQKWVVRMGPNKALWAVAHRMLRLIWKLLAEGIDYQEQGPRKMDHKRLAARMKRLRH